MTRRPRARDIRFFLFSSPVPFGFPRGREGGEQSRREGEKWRHFFPPTRGLSRPRKNETIRNETKRDSRTPPRSFTRSLVSTAIFLSFVSINRVLSSVAAARGNPSSILHLVSPPPSPPSVVPAPDLPMEARSRDKLGQPIGIKSGRIGTPRPRVSTPPFSLFLLLSSLSSERAEPGKTGHGERWKNGRAVRREESRSMGVQEERARERVRERGGGRGNRAPPTRKLIDTIN